MGVVFCTGGGATAKSIDPEDEERKERLGEGGATGNIRAACSLLGFREGANPKQLDVYS